VTKRAVDRKAADYRPTRGTLDSPRGAASSVLRAVRKGEPILPATLTELLDLLHTKTDYAYHVAVEILPTGSAILKTIDNERDAQETIRRLKTKKPC
jgi:hypothetical protein